MVALQVHGLDAVDALDGPCSVQLGVLVVLGRLGAGVRPISLLTPG